VGVVFAWVVFVFRVFFFFFFEVRCFIYKGSKNFWIDFFQESVI